LVTRIPITIVNWLIATIRPRICAGEISAIYKGDNIDAIPTPAPAKNLAIIKISLVGAIAIAIEERANKDAAVNRPGRRPYFSATHPATRQPAIAPKARHPVVKPSQYSFKPNCSFKNGNAPDITAKSKPNK